MSGLLPIDLRSDFQPEISQPPTNGCHEFWIGDPPRLVLYSRASPVPTFARNTPYTRSNPESPRSAAHEGQANERTSAQHQVWPHRKIECLRRWLLSSRNA